MKNIEKYTNTKDALEVYESNRKNTWYTFEQWLDCEYEDQSFPTLLEAAECALKAFEERDEYGNLEWVKDRMRQLCVAIKREKHKPVRNCDVGTTEEQSARFQRFCDKYTICHKCPLWRGGGPVYRCYSFWSNLLYRKGETK